MSVAIDHTVSSMQRDVLSVGEDWSLHNLVGFLMDKQISGAPVTTYMEHRNFERQTLTWS